MPLEQPNNDLNCGIVTSRTLRHGQLTEYKPTHLMSTVAFLDRRHHVGHPVVHSRLLCKFNRRQTLYSQTRASLLRRDGILRTADALLR